MITDEQWTTIRERRGDADFLYGVSTTRIFCRPGCASRAPRRENVRVFDSPAAAVENGYRPCLRCHPDSSRESLAGRARAIIDASSDELPLGELAARLGVSRFHLQRTFRSEMGLSPSQYARARRRESLRERLRDGDDILTAAWTAGYGSTSRIYEHGAASLGMTPGTYRRGGTGETIRWVIEDCSLGRMLVATTDRGVCALFFGEDVQALELSLRAEFPHASFENESEAMRELVRSIIAAVEEGADPSAIPLDVRATTFRLRVWEALRRIPRGETRTYAQIAREVGSPDAARAVGQACATNRISYLIPCHRVVPSDGGQGSYRWGAGRKRRLLDLESE